MSYADFGAWFFAGKLVGCFVAFAISLRGSNDSRVMVFVYGAWIAFVYGLTHTILVDPVSGLRAPQILGYWWYLFQAIVAAFPVICVLPLHEAGARRTFAVIGIGIVALDFVFFVSATPWLIDHRLPGPAFFDVAATLESLQVLSLMFLNNASRRGLARAGRFIAKLWRWPWTDHPRLEAPRI